MTNIEFKPGLRAKSILLALLSATILLAFFIFHIIPSHEKQAADSLKKSSERHLLTLSAAVVNPLLKRQYAELYELLDAQKVENPSWLYLELVAENGSAIYPLSREKPELAQDQISIQTPIKLLNENLGTLYLIVNIQSELNELRLHQYKSIFAVLFVLLFLLLIIVLFIEKKITSPLAQLNQAFKQLANQNYDFTLPPYRSDEVGEVIFGFQQMRSKMQQHQSRLNALLKSEKSMTLELRALMKQAESARYSAEQANEAKSQFLSSMSHELRTPMNAIIGFTELLAMNDEQNLTPSQTDYLHEILQAGNHLLALINEVLDLSKIEAGELKVSMEGVDLNQTVDECIKLIAPLAESKNIHIINKIDQSFSYLLFADNIRFKQILLNLLSNAVKYNPQYGSITLAVQATSDSRVKILVSDTGKGLSETQQQKLFQAFERIDAEFSGIQGTGIGLVISKRLIELMNGEIGVSSIPNIGSTFWLELNFTATVEFAPKPNSAITNARLASSDTNAQPDALVLYVEDNPANLKFVEELIRKRGNTDIITAPTPLLGLELANAHRPDLILLDINLPGMDGFELLARLRTHEHLKTAPIVAISANATSKDVQKGLQAGFLDYLTKPIDIALFYKMLDRTLSRQTETAIG